MSTIKQFIVHIHNFRSFIIKNWIETLLVIFSLFFSFWLMFHTFSYQDGQMLIAGKAWSDFASHIPLIRSFSLGDNFPPEYPLFPGEPIRYHFLFYALVGMIEKVGVQIDYALNIPSALSFAALILAIYFFAKFLFRNRAVGLLSVVFFLFNGSLSFFEFFKTHPLSINTIKDMVTNTTFPSFGPYDGKIISAFWNLNIYTNQRHLAFSFFIVFLITYILYFKTRVHNRIRNSLIAMFLLGILFFTNQAAFVIAFILTGWYVLLNPTERFVTGITAVGTLLVLFFQPIMEASPSIKLHPVFLLPSKVIFSSFILYWFLNFGLSLLLIPIGMLLAPKSAKQFIIPLLFFFVIANIFQFSPDIINNHKFFNFFLILGNTYAAFAILQIWNEKKTLFFGRVISIILFFALILSGVIDFMPIKNDSKIALADIPRNKDAEFFMNTSPKRAVVLNSNSLYHPASIAGRPIFFGYSYFSWSFGYDVKKREAKRLKIFRAEAKNTTCKELLQNNILFVELSKNLDPQIQPDWNFWKDNFVKVYENNKSGITIYDVSASCANK